MDWSKKIGTSIILVLVLTACGSRNNYGSVYFSSGDILVDSSLSYDLSASDYMTYAESVNDDSDTIGSIISQEELSFEIGSLDTLSSEEKALRDTLLNTDIYSTDTLETNYLIPNKELLNDTVFIDTIKMVKVDSSSVIVNDSVESINVEDYLILDSMNYEKSDSVSSEYKLKKVSDLTKIIYTDTIGLIREKELENKKDSVNVSKEIESKSTSKAKSVVSVNQPKESLEEIADSISKEDIRKKEDPPPTYLDEEAIDSNANISEADTLFYSVSFDSTDVSLNESNIKTLNALIKEADQNNYVLQLSGGVNKSDTEESDEILSNERVNVVLDYLLSQGLDKRNMLTLPLNQKYTNSSLDLKEGIVYCRLTIQH